MHRTKILKYLFCFNLLLCASLKLEAYSSDMCAPGAKLIGRMCKEEKVVMYKDKKCNMEILYDIGRIQKKTRYETIDCEDAYYTRNFIGGKLQTESVKKKCRNGSYPNTWGICQEKQWTKYLGEDCLLINQYRINNGNYDLENRTDEIICKNTYLSNEYKNNELLTQKEFASDTKYLLRETLYKNNKKDGIETHFCPTSTQRIFQKTSYIDGLKNGVEKTYDCTDRGIQWTILQTTYKNGKKEGVEKEYYFTYTPQAVIKMETPYRLGEKNGKELEYSKNGDLKREVVYKNGKKEGVEKEYCGAQVCTKIFYKNGKKEGVEKRFDSNGNLLQKTPYKDGKKNGIEIQYYQSRKILERETPYKDGKKNGIEIQYYTNGKIKEKTSYLDGKKHGISVLFAENGKKISETFFQNDLMNGKTTEYYINGKIKSEALYKNNNKNGVEKNYSRKGFIVKEIYWEDGQKNGLERTWKNGKVFYSIQFEKDIATSISGTCSNGKKIVNGHLHIINQYGTSSIEETICNQ